jgi:hypothetical protein
LNFLEIKGNASVFDRKTSWNFSALATVFKHHHGRMAKGSLGLPKVSCRPFVQARTEGGIHGYLSLETPIYQVRNLQDLVGNFSDTLIKEKEGQEN